MRGRGRARWAGLAAAAGLVAAACGGASNSGLPDYRPEDYPPTLTVIFEDGFELAPGGSARFDLRMPPHDPDWSFDVFATIDWTDPANNVVAAFGGESCGGVNLALADACDAGVRFADPSLCPAKPRVVTAQASSSSLIRLYVANTAASPESGRVQVVICEDHPDCFDGAACGQCSLDRRDAESCP